MSQVTITGDNSPAGILRYWERKPKTECAREILRCWQKIDRLSADLDGLSHRDTDKARRIQELERQLAKLPDPAYDRHTSELLDSQAYQMEQLAKAVLAGDEAKAKQLAEEVLK